MIPKREMKNLRNYTGKEVTVEYVLYGHQKVERGKLKMFREFRDVWVGSTHIPFIGYGCAIQRIYDENGRVIYENPLISEDYDLRTIFEIDRLTASSFGKDVARELRGDFFR